MTCERCQATYECMVNDTCWCLDYPHILSLNSQESCFCPDCLSKMIQERISVLVQDDTPENRKLIASLGTPKKLKEGIDYYINEDGLYVFTRWYHLRKGYCCGNGCLHCPYTNNNHNGINKH